MEVLASILGSAIVSGDQLSYGCYRNIRNFVRFQSNRSALEKEMKSLTDLRNKVKEEIDSSDTQIIEWLREVEQMGLEVNSTQAGNTANTDELCACFFNCRERYRLSRETARLFKEVERLLKTGNITAKMVGRSYLAKPVEHIPGPSIENQTTTSTTLDKIMNLLNNANVLRIGVWGMGGVGKTTLVRNLNNKLVSNSSTAHFSIVIWATVSKELDLKRVQVQIAERLNLFVYRYETVERLASRLHQRLQKERKFLLILDDVWETVDLESLGVPQPETRTGSKIIVSSRSLEVCREMKTDQEVKVDVLNDEEAWELFSRNAGEVTSLEHIEPLARAVAKECSGLPLAIITLGTAMRGKRMVALWKDVLYELQRSVPYIKGMENKLYKPLKWSYDSLQGKNIKPCFLYCSLYPEDFSIEVSELVNCWLAEGLIDEQLNYEESHNRGIALIESLKDSCLLEQGASVGTVKMHDVVRDAAIWISSSTEDGCKSLVRSGTGLTWISEVEISECIRRISYMNNRITGLPDRVINCPEVSTLLLQDNLPLEIIPDGFLEAFQSLRVFNISGTKIKSLPQSILQLGDLRMLILRDCHVLKELPNLTGLSKLQVLDCMATGITELPQGMENLSNLRNLNISRTYNLKAIQGGIISRLSSLEFLDVACGGYIWCAKQEAKDDGQATLKELGCLKQLLVLSMSLKGIPSYESWMRRLIRFQFFIGSEVPSLPNKLDENRVTISDLNINGERIGWLLTNTNTLVLNRCWGLRKMGEILGINGNYSYAGLRSLTINADSYTSFKPERGCATQSDLLPNLEALHLRNFYYLVSISDFIQYLGQRFSRLRKIEVVNFPKLRYFLRNSNSLLNTGMLEEIRVSFCNKLEELFPTKMGAPNLQIIEVTNCRALLKLPLTDQNANNIKEIIGEQYWWSGLQWDNENTKVRLQPYFKPVQVPDRNFRNHYDSPWQ